MGQIAIRDLGKAYKQYGNRWGRLLEWIFPLKLKHHSMHWVLRHIDFDVRAGEAVGIIGLNGAGKSTLLKLVTGTAHPTEGSVTISGRVAALLELGMGFHPDFTGRQNALTAGQLLGLSSSQIQSLMQSIEAFAEIGSYIDQPVRVYSSGMQVRLAFALATAVRPDVLIVDEALSVGDAYFQHKCLMRIREYREAGTTLLLVSHDKQAIKSMCDRAIFLHQGRIESEGRPEVVLDYYNAMLADFDKKNVQQTVLVDGRVVTISGSGEASISEVRLLNAAGFPTETLVVGESACVHVKIRVNALIETLVLGYGIRDKFGHVMFGSNTSFTDQAVYQPVIGSFLIFSVRFVANLGVGSYSLQLALTNGETHLGENYEWRDMALVFSVINQSHPVFEGCTWLPATVDVVNCPK